MNKQLLSVLVASATLFSFNMNAQHKKCGTMHHLEKSLQVDPSLKSKMERSEVARQKWITENNSLRAPRAIITIPVVVHVLYNSAAQNIADAQIISQIEVLNKDFRMSNTDALTNSHAFFSDAADTGIEFCLAKQDPSGAATTGITRTFTDSVTFSGNDTEKSSATGGVDNWNPEKYMNIWVCEIAGLSLGYATFPDELQSKPQLDGIVITTAAMGVITGVSTVNDLGRTATHEVGHWLNLYHIWGDDVCGDDLVADTRTAEQENYDCPTFPFNANSSCGSDANGEMYMNYMDYVDDACMNMFTAGQGTRMQSALNVERVGLLTSTGCVVTPTGVDELLKDGDFAVFPNPSTGNFTISAPANAGDLSINVHTVVGIKVKSFDNINTFPFEIDGNNLVEGSYFIEISNGTSVITKKIFITN